MRVLLISNTGRPYFEHCKQEIADFLGSPTNVAFVTAASLGNENVYFEKMCQSLVGPPTRGTVRELLHLRWDIHGVDVLNRADALFVGGGNTYALLKRLKETGLLKAIRKKVESGMPYIGSSAGSNIIGSNILTTNDWNVVALTSFESLGLVPFNINPHYVERGISEAPTSETRDDRIAEYHTVWSNPVVGIEESTVLWIEKDIARVFGKGRIKVFHRNEAPYWLMAGDSFDVEIKTHRPTTRVHSQSFSHTSTVS
jgi:dipeptidase E